MRKGIELINWEKGDIYNSSPVLKCVINGIAVTLMIDTGASVSFLDEKFIQKHPALQKLVKRAKYSYSLDSLSGRKLATKSAKVKNLTLLSTVYSQEFCVCDLNLPQENKAINYDGILGFDFLMRNKITLNFKDFMITDSK